METIQKQKTVSSKSDVTINEGTLLIRFEGNTYRFDLRKLSPRLAAASDIALSNFVVSPSGYGIHWAELDEDISIHALLSKE